MSSTAIEVIAKRDSSKSLIAQVSALSGCLGVKARDIIATSFALRYSGLNGSDIGIHSCIHIADAVGIPYYLQLDGRHVLVDEAGPRFASSLEEVNGFLKDFGYAQQSGNPPPKLEFTEAEDIENMLSSFEKNYRLYMERDWTFGHYTEWAHAIQSSGLSDRDKGALLNGILDISVTLILENKKIVDEVRTELLGENTREREFAKRLIGIAGIRDKVVYIRSIWDKIFELTPIVFPELTIDKSSKSKRGAFLKRLDRTNLTESDSRWESVAIYVRDLELFEQRYRTPEIHLSGGLVGKYLRLGEVEHNEVLAIWNEGIHPLRNWRSLILERLSQVPSPSE